MIFLSVRGPCSTTSPVISWPKTQGLLNGISPFITWRSEWHTPHAAPVNCKCQNKLVLLFSNNYSVVKINIYLKNSGIRLRRFQDKQTKNHNVFPPSNHVKAQHNTIETTKKSINTPSIYNY